jgi:hypothetical protein
MGKGGTLGDGCFLMASADFVRGRRGGCCRFWRGAIGGGAAAGSAGWGAARLAKGGIAEGVAIFAFGRKSIWRGGCGACGGAGDLVGAAAGVAGEDSGNDGAVAARVSMVCGAAELCGDALRRATRWLRGEKERDFTTEGTEGTEKNRRTARNGCPTLGFCGGG